MHICCFSVKNIKFYHCCDICLVVLPEISTICPFSGFENFSIYISVFLVHSTLQALINQAVNFKVKAAC